MYYLFLLLIVLLGIVAIHSARKVKIFKLKQKQVAEVKVFQRENKLSKNELKIFEDVMRDTKEYIIALENNIKNSKILSENKIISRGCDASKAIFENLMDNPKNLIRVGDFLYKTLPLLSTVSEEYLILEEKGEVLKEIKNSKIEFINILQKLSKKSVTYYEELIKEKRVIIDLEEEAEK